MSGFFGVDFFRVVNEGLVDDWAQVYAKVPFEGEDLVTKGALFGVLRIKDKKLVSKGSDIFLWLDEYFNKTKGQGDLRGLVEGLLQINDKLQAAWIWIMIDDKTGERVVRSTAMNGGVAVIARKGRRVVLAGPGTGSRVVMGELKMGDRLGLGVGGMTDRLAELGSKKDLGKIVDDLNKQLAEETERAVAGLLLEVKKRDANGGTLTSLEGATRLADDRSVPDNDLTSADSGMESAVDDEPPVLIDRDNNVVGPDGIKKKLVGYWLKTFKRRRVVEVKREEGGKNKTLWLGIVFLILFMVSVAAGVVKNKREKARFRWQEEVSLWQKREDEAKSLASINLVGARKLLREIQKEVAEAESVWLGTKYEDEWRQYKQALDESWSDISGERRVEPKLFLGLTLVRSGLAGDRVVGLGDGVGVLDLDLGLMVKIGLEDKKAEVVASDEKKEWRAVGGDGKREVFLTDDGLSLSENEEGLSFDAAVVDPVEVEVFGEGAYVLDAGVSEIWKFGLSSDSITDRRRWLKPGQEIKVGEPVDIDIDGDIWVLGKSGKVDKLRRGSRERFTLTGGPEGMRGDRLAVQPEGGQVAILDIGSSRIVVFDKESGEYLHQLVWDGFSDAKDILYTEDGRLMVLSGDKLYWVEE